ncbi:MAG TPA: tetratricopeptide repeat protein [Nostocaceae cyanobacterium]|nr:tetratricopeptide repeat protein [Nostocaceae cyanobacterium]
MSSNWLEARSAVNEALAGRQTSKALRLLAPWLNGETAENQAQNWSETFDLLARIAQVDFGEAIQTKAQAASEQPDNSQVLYNLGYALIDANRPDLAVAALQRACERDPQEPEFLAELVAALELQGRNQEAVQALEAASKLVESNTLLLYLRAFNALMVADLETPQQLLPLLQQSEDDRYLFMARRIERMLARAKAVQQISSLDHHDLRGWHFVLTGGLLLRLSTERSDGRYGATWDTPIRVKDSLQRLLAVLETWNISVPKVLFPSERNSEITGLAAAALLDCEAATWYGEDEPGLLVVYDARNLIPELRNMLVHHRPLQPLFIQAAEYTKEQPTAPDFLTYLYDRNTSPWGPGFTPDFQLIDTNDFTPQELAQSVVTAEDDSSTDELSQLLRFAEALKDLPPIAQPAALLNEGQRERLWVGSPVHL